MGDFDVPDVPHVTTGNVPLSIGSDRWPGLAKLAEEAAEVVQVVAKVAAYPNLDEGELHPDGTNLVKRLETELGDLQAAIWYVTEQNALSIEARAEAKLSRFRKWDREERVGRSQERFGGSL